MKKVIFGILCFGICISMVNAQSTEVFYTNNNGLEFTEYQYNSMVQILNEKSVANMQSEEYAMYNVSNMTAENSKIAIYDEPEHSITRATYHETAGKKVSISSTCNSTQCVVTVSLVWKMSPVVRSYDVIGVRLSNTLFTTADYACRYYMPSGASYNCSAHIGFSNGSGSLITMPQSGDIDHILYQVGVQPKGKVYGSYQHAVKGISQSNALNFQMGADGLGGVFYYPSAYRSFYDGMGGVYIAIP